MISAPAPTSGSTTALSCRNLRKSFGGKVAVDGAQIDVPQGIVTALIGPNGAGKSTVVNMFSGFMQPDAGTIQLDGIDVTGWASHRIARRGLIRTFQLSRELQGLTVLENLLVTPTNQLGESLKNIYFRPGKVRQQEREYLERARQIL